MHYNRAPKTGFTLVELMVVITIIAIVAAVAVPRLTSARSSTNESAAIATLRFIATAQQQVQAAAVIDTDGDGGGEYGYLGELTGAAPFRVFNGAGAVAGTTVLNPTYVPSSFGQVVADASGQGVVEKQGYFFKMWLPSASATNPIIAVSEAGIGGNGAVLPGASNAEIYWCCYAWPAQATRTGNRAFMINQSGDIIATNNRAAGATIAYSGIALAPNYDAAFSVPLDMGSVPATAAAGLTATDGRVWTPIGN